MDVGIKKYPSTITIEGIKEQLIMKYIILFVIVFALSYGLLLMVTN